MMNHQVPSEQLPLPHNPLNDLPDKPPPGPAGIRLAPNTVATPDPREKPQSDPSDQPDKPPTDPPGLLS
ncbi:hypothetical protein D7V97_38635 [Corallococcus sp. CA053C]|uniref:hypothetical protein n=1 Tax=Corallococcus sp. CA053C TaxID=2316732 RepID=UPI000EA01F6B|nr:hypothetical protein [Corallococcus sp. CA053C]RKG94569.1 hypothetical protein D7V97_38635 [Corallococcus sp. CA053C]